MEKITLARILSRENLEMALDQVIRNNGTSGVDGMPCDKLRDYIIQNWKTLRNKLEHGDYQPSAIRRVPIPKPEGGERILGIPTVLDRFIQQSIAQELDRYYDTKFSESSYGFRRGRSCHDAISQSLKYLNEGNEYIVVIDISKFFDRVNHDSLMYGLSKEIEDKEVLRLIRRYLQSGAMENGVKQQNTEGTPQGGNLSPVLSNIVLDRLDKELEKRRHKFVRYADDISIYVKSERAAKRILEGISEWIVKKLKLQINEEKSGVVKYQKVKLLGFSFYKSKAGIRARIHKTSYARFKRKLKQLTNRSKPYNYRERLPKINQVVVGWLAYFSLADGRNQIKGIDEWLRRRFRCIIWKQWKLVRTRYTNLKKLGVDEGKAYEWANTRKGYWRISASPILHRTITIKRLKDSGYKSLLDLYNRFHENLSNRRDTRTVCQTVQKT